MTWDFVGLPEPAWVDLPRFEEIQAGPYFPAANAELQQRLDSYHRIPKIAENLLIERIEHLNALARFLESLDLPASFQRWLTWLLNMARAKSQFIKTLALILE